MIPHINNPYLRWTPVAIATKNPYKPTIAECLVIIDAHCRLKEADTEVHMELVGPELNSNIYDAAILASRLLLGCLMEYEPTEPPKPPENISVK